MPHRAASLERAERGDVVNAALIAGALAQPAVKIVSAFAPVPGMDLALSLVEKIFAVMEAMRYNKKQCRRLAESARDVVEAVEEALVGLTPEETDSNLTANVDKLVRILKRTADHLREIAALNFVKRLLQYASIQDELVGLDREIQEATTHFMIKFAIDSKRHQMQNEKARRDDQKAMMDELRRVVKDQDELAQRIGLRGGKLDSESQNAIQVILHRIDHEPEKVPQEVKTFAEEATKTIKTRTNFDVPRTLPWFVKTREIKRGVKIGSGGFSVVYKGYWLTRDMNVAVKVFREQDAINELLDEVFIWRSFSHPNLHQFLGAAPFEQPAFVVSPFCVNGNALEYLEKTPTADRLQILHDISQGMAFLHGQNVVHGDLKARNVLIDDSGRGLVADFGLAKFERVTVKSAAIESPGIDADSTPTKPRMVNIVGTLHWLAPECFVEGGVSKASDTWAMGMCAYELFTGGRVPLVEIAADDLGQRLLDGTRPTRVDSIPDSAWTTMERCWAHEPFARPTFSQLCLVLGVFQDSDIESLRQASEGFAGEHWSGYELSRWPGLAERLIAILTSVLKIGPVQSITEGVTADGLFSLSPQSQDRVVSALRVLVTLARSSGEDVSVGQIIVDAGALPALLFILQERSNVDAEILRLGCEILDGLSEGYANETLAIAIASSDFIKALIKLAGGAEIQTARKALDTAGKLVLSKRTFEEESEKKQRAISLGIIPRLLDVFSRQDATDAIIEACNFSVMLALPPVALSVDHIADIIRALIPLVPHIHPGVRLSVLETVRTVLNCRREDVIKIVKEGDGELITAVLDLTEKIDIGTPVPVAQAALNILSDISTIANVPRLVAILRSAEENNINLKLVTVAVLKDIGSGCNTEQKGELAQMHDLFATLTPLLRSPDENVSTWSSEAISAFSTAENIPLLIGFLKGEDERLKLMAIRILKDLVQVGVSEDLKLAVVNSGVLSELHRFLQKPLEQPTTVIGYLQVGDSLSSPIGPFSNPILEVQATDSLPSPNGPSPNISTQSDIDGPPSGGPPDDKQVASSEQPVDQAAAIRQPADAGTFTKVDRVIELRDSAFAILDVIATNASDNGMEIIADAYVHAGIHTALVALLNEPEHDPALPGDDPSRRNCIFVLHELARGADYVKREIIKTEIFEELKRIMDSTNGMALQWCCLMLYHLLSSDEVNEDIVLAIVNADLIERLVASFKGDWNPVSAAQAMSCLVMSTADTTWTKLREQNAITCLREFLQSLESVEGLFASRTWILVEYLDHPQIEAQRFGLFLVNWLLKGGISQRKSVTNTAGMRDALEGCLKSEDDEVKTQAKDLIAKLPSASRRR